MDWKISKAMQCTAFMVDRVKMHTIGISKGILILYIVGDVVASSCLEILLVMYVFNKLFRLSSPVVLSNCCY